MTLTERDKEGPNYVAYWNGNLLKYCIEASEEESYAICYDIDFLFLDAPEAYTLYSGKIDLRRIPDEKKICN